MSAQELFYDLEFIDESLLELLVPEQWDYELGPEVDDEERERLRKLAEEEKRADDAEKEFGLGNIWIYDTEYDDKVCDECKSYRKQIFTSREIAEKWPWAEKKRAMIKPNVHPNCRCRLEVLVTVEVI